MGLDTSHDCWHGAYSAFMRWREKLAVAAGLPPLALMEGFFAKGNPLSDPLYIHGSDRADGRAMLYDALPIQWSALKPDVLHVLLSHSDCDGKLEAAICAPIADRLTELLPRLDGDGGGHIGSYREKTQAFIDGLRRAAASGQDVEFH